MVDKAMDKAAGADQNGGDGSFTRYAFTLAIATAICLSIIAFMYLLEQRTEDPGSRLDLPNRTAAELYADAEGVEIPALRKKALENFVEVYPDSPQASLAKAELDSLSETEDAAFSELSDKIYSVEVPATDKAEALDAFEAEWGSGDYAEDIASMRTQVLLDIPDEEAQAAARAREQFEPKDAPSPAPGEATGMAGGDGVVLDVMPDPQELFGNDDAVPTIVPAKVDYEATPRYPRRAQSRGVEAVVVVSMDIDEEGEVVDVRIIEPASGRYARDFNRAAISAARRTTFFPQTINGEPSPYNGYTQQYRFRMVE